MTSAIVLSGRQDRKRNEVGPGEKVGTGPFLTLIALRPYIKDVRKKFGIFDPLPLLEKLDPLGQPPPPSVCMSYVNVPFPLSFPLLRPHFAFLGRRRRRKY